MSAGTTPYVSGAMTFVAAAEMTADTFMKSTTSLGRLQRPLGMVNEVEMSGVTSAAAANFLARDTIDVLSADTTVGHGLYLSPCIVSATPAATRFFISITANGIFRRM